MNKIKTFELFGLSIRATSIREAKVKADGMVKDFIRRSEQPPEIVIWRGMSVLIWSDLEGTIWRRFDLETGKRILDGHAAANPWHRPSKAFGIISLR